MTRHPHDPDEQDRRACEAEDAKARTITTFGEAMRAARVALGWSQQGLSDRTNWTARTIIRWENSQTSPNPDSIVRLAREFGAEFVCGPNGWRVQWLFHGEDGPR